MKFDPHLQKLLELIYTNIKGRFTVFGNAYRYLDFRNRMGVSLTDFERGLNGFGLHFPRADRTAVFNYLGEGCQQMTFDQFMRLQTEAGERNVDPFELQVFQEALTVRAADEERKINTQRKDKEIETMS